MKLEKGTTIFHYNILSEIGKGGMGESVWNLINEGERERERERERK